MSSPTPDPAAECAPVARREPPPAGGPAPLILPGGGAGGDSSPQNGLTEAAGMPYPETGAADPATQPAAPVRGRPRSSRPLPEREADAGTAAPGHRAEPAHTSLSPDRVPPRTFTITLPAGLALLSLNDRGHWAARYRRSEALRKAAWAMALQAKIPRLERVSVVAEYQPGDLRHRDPDNIAASAKAAIDGLRAARVLPEDDSRHVTEVTCRIGPLHPKGRLILHLTEVPGGTDGAA